MNFEKEGISYTTAHCDDVYDEIVEHLKNVAEQKRHRKHQKLFQDRPPRHIPGPACFMLNTCH